MDVLIRLIRQEFTQEFILNHFLLASLHLSNLETMKNLNKSGNISKIIEMQRCNGNCFSLQVHSFAFRWQHSRNRSQITIERLFITGILITNSFCSTEISKNGDGFSDKVPSFALRWQHLETDDRNRSQITIERLFITGILITNSFCSTEISKNGDGFSDKVPSFAFRWQHFRNRR